jgi:hypothetical protein
MDLILDIQTSLPDGQGLHSICQLKQEQLNCVSTYYKLIPPTRFYFKIISSISPFGGIKGGLQNVFLPLPEWLLSLLLRSVNTRLFAPQEVHPEFVLHRQL